MWRPPSSHRQASSSLPKNRVPSLRALAALTAATDMMVLGLECHGQAVQSNAFQLFPHQPPCPAIGACVAPLGPAVNMIKQCVSPRRSAAIRPGSHFPRHPAFPLARPDEASPLPPPPLARAAASHIAAPSSRLNRVVQRKVERSMQIKQMSRVTGPSVVLARPRARRAPGPTSDRTPQNWNRRSYHISHL